MRLPSPSMTSPTVPDELLGCWRRQWIEYADGARDDTSIVVWLQLPSLMADIRLSAEALSLAGRTGFADCTHAELAVLAANDSSAGTTVCSPFHRGDDGVRRATAEWSSTVGFQEVSTFPEPGLLELNGDGNVMIERAPSGAYVEEWRLLPDTREPLHCMLLPNGASWYRAGDVGVLVHDRRLAVAPLDCEFSFARRRAGSATDEEWVIDASTLPWRVGAAIT